MAEVLSRFDRLGFASSSSPVYRGRVNAGSAPPNSQQLLTVLRAVPRLQQCAVLIRVRLVVSPKFTQPLVVAA